MQSRSSRLDRFLRRHTDLHPREIRRVIAAGEVRVDGQPVFHFGHLVGRFSHVQLPGWTLPRESPAYYMIHKPRGLVSATRDELHPTVMTLLPADAPDGLHIAGRLDATSTGLLLVTNDGAWSSRLCGPDVHKHYLVGVQNPLDDAQVKAFAGGMAFSEAITTRPAGLVIRSAHEAEVILNEGRYHQIRRMFARCGNRAVTIHRFRVGPLWLDAALGPGDCRPLTAEEIAMI